MAFQPIILADAALTLDSGAYEGQISGAVFTPSSSPVTFTAINGDVHTLATKATWTLDLTYAQDWEDATSLSDYLHAHEGEVVSAVFEPVDGGRSFTANVTITPGAIGASDTTAVASSTVSLGSTKPVASALV